ncbi:methyltransferase [Ghiorsea bivora]|uniref:methyltransferase n=1 Tax=Ghiorsea bivora TaxID=1485545 RepID=UPI00068D6BCD|nr:methyltransferase [Ghiorsea bivora]
MNKNIFQYQTWHLLSLSGLLFLLVTYISKKPQILSGSYLNISANTWFWLAIAVPIIHQTYVMLVWRFELYQRTFSQRWGIAKAFKYYTIGFSILFGSRLISIIFVAVSTQNSWNISATSAYALAAIITPLVIYLFYSVKKYFTIERAYGIDHFDPDYDEPYVKQGIFKYTDNGMYVFGLMILYLPGLLLFSKAALLAALFNHLYIWVHYYCTEKPDMLKIYGKTAS